MALGDILGNLGGLAEGYLSGQNKLQQLQSNQYINALKQLALQQAVQQQGAAPAEAATLRGLYGQDQQQPLPQLPQAGLPPVQQSPLSQPSQDMPIMAQQPQVSPDSAAGQMLPKIIGQLESGGGRDIASQPPSMANPLYGQYKGFTDQYGSGAAGVNNFAQAELAAKPNATLGDYYSDYVLGTGKPGSHSLADLQSTSVPGAQGAYKNLVNNAGVSPDTPLMQLAAANQMVMQQRQAMPPQLQQAGQAGAQTTLRNMPENPLSLSGRMSPGRMMKAIDDANPDANDEVKMAAFNHLYPMLSNAGKLDFAEGMQLLRLGQGDERLQTQRDILDLRERLGNQPKGAPYQPTDAEGKPVGPPGVMEGNKFVPVQGLPEGAGGGLSRIGAKPAGGGVSDMQAQWVADYIQKVGTWPATTGRNQLLQNKVEQILAERKVDPTTIAVAKGAFKADETSLTQATKLRDAVHSYEGTALRNLDQATIEMERSSPTNFGPWLNHWVMTGEMQMGDEKPPAAIASVLTFSNEYAKVMSGATGAQAATDSSRREAATILNPYFAKGQWGEASRIARTDMKNRMTELDDNVDIIKSRMGRGGQSSRGESPGVSTSRAAPSGEAGQYQGMSDEDILKRWQSQ
jgi:hypothetical protein